MFCITAFDLFFETVTFQDKYDASYGDVYISVRGDIKCKNRLFKNVYPDAVVCYDKVYDRYKLHPGTMHSIKDEYLFIPSLSQNAPVLRGQLSCYIAGPKVSPGWNHMQYTELLFLMMHYAHVRKDVLCAGFLGKDYRDGREPSIFVKVVPEEVHMFFGKDCTDHYKSMARIYSI